MGSHHHQEAILVPDGKLDRLRFIRIFSSLTKMVQLFIRNQCCHLGLMAPYWISILIHGYSCMLGIYPCLSSRPSQQSVKDRWEIELTNAIFGSDHPQHLFSEQIQEEDFRSDEWVLNLVNGQNYRQRQLKPRWLLRPSQFDSVDKREHSIYRSW